MRGWYRDCIDLFSSMFSERWCSSAWPFLVASSRSSKGCLFGPKITHASQKHVSPVPVSRTWQTHAPHAANCRRLRGRRVRCCCGRMRLQTARIAIGSLVGGISARLCCPLTSRHLSASHSLLYLEVTGTSSTSCLTSCISSGVPVGSATLAFPSKSSSIETGSRTARL